MDGEFDSGLSAFKGNVLSCKEKMYRLQRMIRCEIDPEMLSRLDKINAFPFIVTTQSCTGHNEPPNGRRAHIDFRSMLSESDTINLLLRPMQEKYSLVTVQLFTECKRLRYCLWLDNDVWEEQIGYFITLLARIWDETK